MAAQITSTCPGCKIVLPITNYPADNRYGVASAECRQALDEILMKEGELFSYPAVHRLIIDAYGVQHPPHAEVQEALGVSKRFVDASIQSIGIHLIALYLAIEKKMELRKIAGEMDKVLSNMTQRGANFKELKPPVSLGIIRAADVRDALYAQDDISLEDYEILAWNWAREAWKVWHAHHKAMEAWYNMYRQ
jgi:hypothetical protein